MERNEVALATVLDSQGVTSSRNPRDQQVDDAPLGRRPNSLCSVGQDSDKENDYMRKAPKRKPTRRHKVQESTAASSSSAAPQLEPEVPQDELCELGAELPQGNQVPEVAWQMREDIESGAIGQSELDAMYRMELHSVGIVHPTADDVAEEALGLSDDEDAAEAMRSRAVSEISWSSTEGGSSLSHMSMSELEELRMAGTATPASFEVEWAREDELREWLTQWCQQVEPTVTSAWDVVLGLGVVSVDDDVVNGEGNVLETLQAKHRAGEISVVDSFEKVRVTVPLCAEVVSVFHHHGDHNRQPWLSPECIREHCELLPVIGEVCQTIHEFLRQEADWLRERIRLDCSRVSSTLAAAREMASRSNLLVEEQAPIPAQRKTAFDDLSTLLDRYYHDGSGTVVTTITKLREVLPAAEQVVDAFRVHATQPDLAWIPLFQIRQYSPLMEAVTNLSVSARKFACRWLNSTLEVQATRAHSDLPCVSADWKNESEFQTWLFDYFDEVSPEATRAIHMALRHGLLRPGFAQVRFGGGALQEFKELLQTRGDMDSIESIERILPPCIRAWLEIGLHSITSDLAWVTPKEMHVRCGLLEAIRSTCHDAWLFLHAEDQRQRQRLQLLQMQQQQQQQQEQIRPLAERREGRAERQRPRPRPGRGGLRRA